MVILIGELMKQAERYIADGLHPRIIAEVRPLACVRGPSSRGGSYGARMRPERPRVLPMPCGMGRTSAAPTARWQAAGATAGGGARLDEQH